MADWRDDILKEFTPELSRLTLVADPDGLLTEETVQTGIRKRGFELITFDDPIDFRYAYESQYRLRWDSGQSTELVVALRSDSDSLRCLPFDLLQAGRALHFHLSQIFPNLSYPIIQLLKPTQWDQLYQAQLLHGGNILGDRGTMDFILDHVFDCLPKHTWAAKDLLRALLRHHYLQEDLPQCLAQRVVEILSVNETFRQWPLSHLVGNKEDFLRFIQEQWPRFVRSRLFSRVMEDLPGDLHLPFDHEDVRVYLDNYFTEGLLKPIHIDGDHVDISGTISFGVSVDPVATVSRRLAKIVDVLTAELPSTTATSYSWQTFAFRWAEFNALCLEAEMLGVTQSDILFAVRRSVDSRFTCWLQERYSTLASQSPHPPVMVHHIARHLARVHDEQKRSVALIVVDGLALDQWNILRKSISIARPSWAFSESTAFAWIPTLTSVSRQAIFSAKSPFFFSPSIETTSKEPVHWKAFWNDVGVPDHKSCYVKLTHASEGPNWRDFLPSLETIEALGIVLTAMDEIVHGIVLGPAQLRSSVGIWHDSGTLTNMVSSLLEAGFYVALTSDHGNTRATGVGAPRDGLLAEVRGERVRIYPDENLRSNSAAAITGALAWTPRGLPSNFHPLFAPSNQAFFNVGESRICHGGISLEEVLVPFVEISLREGQS